MVTIQQGKFKPIKFEDMLDPGGLAEHEYAWSTSTDRVLQDRSSLHAALAPR